MTKQPDYGSIENRVVVASFDGALLGIYHGHSVLVEIAQSPIPHPTQAHPGAPRVRYESPSAIEWAMPGRDTGGFVDSQSKNAAGWWSGWSGAQRRRSKPKFLRFSRTPARFHSISNATEQKPIAAFRCRTIAAKKFHLMQRVERLESSRRGEFFSPQAVLA